MRLDMLTTAGNVHEKSIRKVDTYLQNRRYIISHINNPYRKSCQQHRCVNESWT